MCAVSLCQLHEPALRLRAVNSYGWALLWSTEDGGLGFRLVAGGLKDPQ